MATRYGRRRARKPERRNSLRFRENIYAFRELVYTFERCLNCKQLVPAGERFSGISCRIMTFPIARIGDAAKWLFREELPRKQNSSRKGVFWCEAGNILGLSGNRLFVKRY